MAKTVIEAGQKILFNRIFSELFRYRDLLYVLAYRDYKVRYAQTYLGFAWALLQPLLTLGIFVLVFGRVARVDTGEVPYPLFALAGMVPWSYFSFLMSQAGNSVINAQGLIKKVYFPRLVIPLSKSIVGFIDFSLSFSLLVVFLFVYGFAPSSNMIWAPVFVLLTLISGLAVGFWMSALTVRYRDFQHVLPFLVQLGIYATPVAYPSTLIDEQYRIYYFLNPMAGVVEGFRWSVLGGEPPGAAGYISFSLVIILFVSGLWYFRKVEKIMADIV